MYLISEKSIQTDMPAYPNAACATLRLRTVNALRAIHSARAAPETADTYEQEPDAAGPALWWIVIVEVERYPCRAIQAGTVLIIDLCTSTNRFSARSLRES